MRYQSTPEKEFDGDIIITDPCYIIRNENGITKNDWHYCEYGEPDKDESGNETGTISIKVGSPNFKAFCDELAPFNEMEHEVELMTAKYEDTIGCLSGEEILLLDWMLED